MYGLRMGLSISEILLIMAHAPFSIRLQVTLSLRPNSLASPRSQYHLSIIQSLPIGFHLVLSWLSCVAFGKRPRILRVKQCVHSWFCFIRMEVKTILFRSLRSGMAGDKQGPGALVQLLSLIDSNVFIDFINKFIGYAFFYPNQYRPYIIYL